MSIFTEMNQLTEHFFRDYKDMLKKVIEEEDWLLPYEKFRKKHPSFEKWEWEEMQKKIQEV